MIYPSCTPSLIPCLEVGAGFGKCFEEGLSVTYKQALPTTMHAANLVSVDDPNRAQSKIALYVILLSTAAACQVLARPYIPYKLFECRKRLEMQPPITIPHLPIVAGTGHLVSPIFPLRPCRRFAHRVLLSYSGGTPGMSIAAISSAFLCFFAQRLRRGTRLRRALRTLALLKVFAVLPRRGL